MADENQVETPQTEPGVETTQAEPQPEIGAQVPADAQVPPVEGEVPANAPDGGNGEAPAEAGTVTPAPTVSEPVNQPEVPQTPEADEPAKAQEPKPVQELVSRYAFGVYLKKADRVELFEVEFMSRSSKANETVAMLLKENVDNVEDYTVRLKKIELVTVYHG